MTERPHGALVAILLALLLAACASDVTPLQSPFERKLPRALQTLQARSDADSIAAAAELTDWPTSNAEQRLALLTRAVALSPDRADLVWLQLEACGSVASCDPEPLATRLHVLDEDNGAAWGLLLSRATKAGDSRAVRNCLNAIAGAKRFDIYWNPTIARLSAAVSDQHAMDMPTALTAVIGTEAALAIPAYQDLSMACKAPALQEPGRTEACRKISEVLRRGDTYITEMIGVAIAKRVWPEASVEYASAVEARRLAHYRMHTMGSILPASFRTEAEARQYVTLLATHRSEQEAAIAVITAAGKSPDPPPNWKEN